MGKNGRLDQSDPSHEALWDWDWDWDWRKIGYLLEKDTLSVVCLARVVAGEQMEK